MLFYIGFYSQAISSIQPMLMNLSGNALAFSGQVLPEHSTENDSFYNSYKNVQPAKSKPIDDQRCLYYLSNTVLCLII